MEIYEEGKARIKFNSQSFLNPKAQLSRDLSVAFVKYKTKINPKATVIDTTSATGIRGIRYYKEGGAKEICMLEINNSAFKDLKGNMNYNKMNKDSNVRYYNTSIQEFANSSVRESFDIIDLDPFGSAAPNLTDIMKLARDKSSLMITATDVAVLCGAHYKACLKTYFAQPLHNALCHEVGIRILLGYIARIASLFNFGIEPEISISYLHYVRLFLKLDHGAAAAVKNYESIGYALYCKACGNFALNSPIPHSLNCNVCGHEYSIAGPLWVGRIQDKTVINGVKEVMSQDKVKNDEMTFMSNLSSELDTPLYYSIPALTKMMNVESVSYDRLKEELQSQGHSISKTHMNKESIKTDAGISEVKAAILKVLKSRNMIN
ncbi:N2,N2-dimethylguanosine tRNA methyltransferase [Candidatus Mancarchaeum acidiphilum]|uniref:tRNA (guanine(26)-N(2))-dimethyltransferase n=1 Tax=Candidatus Mancarchaeum acidiphilum TaxID=1920749 RepID=A0A218NM57_9ARCH|nr:hypothetical protein [Candidatus Mancarchaeum acidiphilum]ASI13546.1 N2,N2-dimethylguanosine tRNA methyltransferase [Candidatus Mancarchaeum acidiphilum]